MRSLLGFSLAALVAVACSTHSAAPAVPFTALVSQVPVWVDARFPAERKADVESAISRWNVALGGIYVFTLASDELERPRDLLTIEGPLVWGVTVTYQPAMPALAPYLAAVIASNNVQFFASNFTSERWDSVSLHEFGHVLGLDDEEPGAKLMRSMNGPWQDCIDQGTIVRLAHRHPAWRKYLHAECE